MELYCGKTYPKDWIQKWIERNQDPEKNPLPKKTMNFGSPLSKDQRMKKQPAVESFPKEKLLIGVAVVKKILKPLNLENEIGVAECRWVNHWVENEVQGKCLPKSFLSGDFLSEVEKAFGVDAAKGFLDRLREEFVATAPKGVVTSAKKHKV